MNNKLITVIIKSIGRKSINDAINSALKEGFPVIVCFDGPVENPITIKSELVSVYTLGKKYGHYGSMAINTAVSFASSPYITFLDDDDEFFPGAGKFMRKKVSSNPEVDIWIPGLRFNAGKENEFELCRDSSRGVAVGNIAVPTYKAEIFSQLPITPLLVPSGGDPNVIDFYHVALCEQLLKLRIEWYNKILYNVRPNLGGTNGRGR